MPNQRSLFREYYSGDGESKRMQAQKELQVKTRLFLEELNKSSTFFSSMPPERHIPHLKGLQVGSKVLGMGEFGVVREIANVPSCCTITSGETDGSPESNVSLVVGSTTTQAPPSLAYTSTSLSCGSSTRSRSLSSVGSNDLDGNCCTQSGEADAAFDDLTHSRQNIDNARTPQQEEGNSSVIDSSRSRMPLHPGSICLKQIRQDLYPKQRLQAVTDLAREARFLAHTNHPNIVQMMATVSEPGHVEFGIVLQRLGMTLQEQVVTWKREAQLMDNASTHGGSTETNSGLLTAWFPAKSVSTSSTTASHTSSAAGVGNESTELPLHYTQKRQACRDVANALQYLHSHHILLRDIKPENVAWHPEEECWKIFDFGLAKELPLPHRQHLWNGVVGTPRLMAPEIARVNQDQDEKPVNNESFYGLPSDVYSFGVLAWEVWGGMETLAVDDVISAKLPLQKLYSTASYLEQRRSWKDKLSAISPVSSENQEGKEANDGLPFLESFIPRQLQVWICQSWEDDPKRRPTISEFATFLQHFSPTPVNVEISSN